ncbi:MAG: translation initiation factor IF-2 [Chloroflexota bacterium]|nr:translation initiation factor IF-2 [Chloroflexota bacterium]
MAEENKTSKPATSQSSSKPTTSSKSQPKTGGTQAPRSSASSRPPRRRRPNPPGRRRRRRKPRPRPTAEAPSTEPTPAAQPPSTIELPETITVREMAELMQRSPIDIMKVLMNFGIMAPITQTLDYDTAAIVAEEMGVQATPIAKAQEETTAEEETLAHPKTLRQRLLEDTPEELLVIRPPVITVLGHVDHGKTTLLDSIRKTDVVSGESGGITQHIGAYQIIHDGRKITFLDTPGHEAFTAMRARGAQATDIAILVVAADDGVMPQTREAIAHVRAAGVPIVVALNKVDKANANPDRVKQELAEQDLIVEDWGGDVICVPVSALQNQGIDDLLENLLLVADVEVLQADPEGPAIGTVIEALLDRNRGVTATLLVQKGTLRVGDAMVIGTTSGRVRAMFDNRGEPVESAGPSTPVKVLGISQVPTAGDIFQVTETDKLARERAEQRVERRRAAREDVGSKGITLDDVFAQMLAGKVKELRLVLKADVDGSLEPIVNSLKDLGTDELRVKLLQTGTGEITESDLMLAVASNAIVLGFNTQPTLAAQKSDLVRQVDVRIYEVIYELIDDIDKALKGLLDPVYEDKSLGRAEVRAVFKIRRRGNIAGCYVSEGEIRRNALARVYRGDEILSEGKFNSLKRFQDDVNEVKSGFECGIGIDTFDDFKEGDIIEAYQKVRV